MFILDLPNIFEGQKNSLIIRDIKNLNIFLNFVSELKAAVGEGGRSSGNGWLCRQDGLTSESS